MKKALSNQPQKKGRALIKFQPKRHKRPLPDVFQGMETVRTSISLYPRHEMLFHRVKCTQRFNRVIRRWVPRLRALIESKKGITIGYQQLPLEDRARVIPVSFLEDIYLDLGMLRAGSRVSVSKMIAWILDRHFENHSHVNYQEKSPQNRCFSREIEGAHKYHTETTLASTTKPAYRIRIWKIPW